MAYRDDLDAAHARIAALEAALRERGDGEEADALREALDDARKRIGEVTQGAHQLRADRDRLLGRVNEAQRMVAGFERPTSGTLISLAKFNRRLPPLTGGRGAGVACPACADVGLQTELRTSLLPPPGQAPAGLEAVSCPACLFVGWKRRVS